MLEDTLVIWGGEFGRTPFIQGNINDRPKWGRDHHPYAFTIWMADGGVKPGLTYGASDDLAMDAVVDKVHVHDFQATLLHLMGIDHRRLTYRFQGRVRFNGSKTIYQPVLVSPAWPPNIVTLMRQLD